MKFEPTIDEIKKDQEFLKGKAECFNFLKNNLNDDWTFFYRPHLNGLSPDVLLLNPRKGIQLINFYDEDKSLIASVNNLEIAKKQIPNLYSPRIKTFLMRNYPGLADMPPIIVLAIAAPKMSAENIIALHEKYGIRPNRGKTESGDDINETYYPIISKEVIASNEIKKAVPSLKMNVDSILMKQEFVDDLMIWLRYPDEKRERFRKIELDATQKRLATTRTESGYRRIKGAAGSGKSQVLAARAVNLALEGKEVLLLTFNITLYRYLFSLIRRINQVRSDTVWRKIVLLHYHDFANDCIWDPVNYGKPNFKNLFIFDENDKNEVNKRLDQSENEGKSRSEIEFEMIDERVLSVIKESPVFMKYDAILVDEGQDWDLTKWKALRNSIVEGGELMLVADQTQDIYGKWVWTEGAMKGAGFTGDWTVLKGSYRLPRSFIKYVRAFASQFIEESSSTLPELIPQQTELAFGTCHLDWKQLPDYEDTTNKCVEVISSRLPMLMKQFPPSDITFLAIDNEHGNNAVHKLKEDKNIEVMHTFGYLPNERKTKKTVGDSFLQSRSPFFDDERKFRKSQKMEYSIDTNQIKATTIHSFKGWESPALVIQIERGKDKDGNVLEAKEEYFAMIYTALTRLREGHKGASYIYVVCSDPIFDEYQKTWNT